MCMRVVPNNNNPLLRAFMAHPSRPIVTVYVDSMALRFISSTRAALVRVTDPHPSAFIDTVSGSIPVDAIGVAGFNMRDHSGAWHYVEIPDAHICPGATVELYSVQSAFAAFGGRHHFDDVNEIVLPGGIRVPFSSTPEGYPLPVIYGPPVPGAISHVTRVPYHQLACAALPGGLALTWRRLGFPFEAQWQRSLSTVAGVFTADAVRRGKLPSVDRFTEPTVLRGRMRALPLYHAPRAERLKPGERVYMDGCGPLLPSLHTQLTDYIGCVDAGSGYAYLLPCVGQSEHNATTALAFFIAELRSLIGSQSFLSPLVVRTDGGSAFIALRFQEFCTRYQMHLTYSAPYEPNQNSFIERVWGSRFATARVLLASANLPARFHVYALRVANYLHNRLPSLARGGLSPYELLCGRPPDLGRLRAFGCAAAVWRNKAVRIKDKGVAKLTADHADFGVYLGLSEDYPDNHVVYIPSSNRVLVSPHCVFDEGTFPGSRSHAATDWGLALQNAARSTPALQHAAPMVTSLLPAPAVSACSPAAAIRRDEPAFGSCPASALPVAAPVAEGEPLAPPSASAQGSPPAPLSDAPPAPSLDGDYWRVTSPRCVGVDGRAKRSTPARLQKRRGSCLQQAFAAIVGPDVTPARLATHVAPLFAPSPVFAYLAVVGSLACAALPQPDFNLADCRIPKGYGAAMRDVHSDYWVDAIDREWSGIMANDSLDFVRRRDMPPGANLMNSHFVFDIKPRPDGSIEKFKARLVADGNTQKHGVDFDQVFATVVKLSSIRLALVLAATLGWGLWQYDVRQAFLQADIAEDLFMRVPPHLPDRDEQGELLVCKLKKSLYGLKQAAREWAQVLAATLVGFGFRRSIIDTCMYRYDGADGRVLLLLTYVDDLILAYSHDDIRQRFTSYLVDALPIDDRGALQWVLRMEVRHDRTAHTLVLSQQQYVLRLLARFLPDGAERAYDTPLDERCPLDAADSPAPGTTAHADMESKRSTYMSAVGALLWLAAGTRPDLTYAVSALARFSSNPGRAHYVALLRVLSYLSATRDRVLRFAPADDRELDIYTDSSWTERFSTSGGVALYRGCAVAWWSRLQRLFSGVSLCVDG